MSMSRKTVLAGAALMAAAFAAGAASSPQSLVPGGLFAARAQARAQAFAASLDLTDAQRRTFQQLSTRELAFRGDARADLAQLATRVKADLADPHADLHATARTIQDEADRLIAQHREITTAKLAFYDGLDATQQAKVREALLAKIDRLERLRDALVAFADAQ